MGYPMGWSRLRNRNALWGTYRQPDPDEPPNLQAIAGDAQRLEDDSMDGRHLEAYAAVAGIGIDQAARLLRVFFELPEPECAECQKLAERYPWQKERPAAGTHRCNFHSLFQMASRRAPA